MKRSAVLHPVILALPEAAVLPAGRQRVALLRERARQAVQLSAKYRGVVLGPLAKDAAGAPLPSNGQYWSLSHKEALVAGVTATGPVGIDLEKIRPCNEGLYQRLATDSEWNLAAQRSVELFFRFWTAKEAVLKAVGKGLSGLAHCRILAIADEHCLQVAYAERRFTVSHVRVGPGYLAALTAERDTIQWHLPEKEDPCM